MGVYIGGIPNLITSQIQGPCPSGFHVPTIYEWTRVINIMRRLTYDNNNGYLYLKLPNAYYRNYAGTALNTSIFNAGGYWSCTPKVDNQHNAYVFRRDPNGGGRYNSGRCLGLYIRPFKDTVAIPDSSWTTILSNSQGSIMWDQTNGLISLGNTYGNWITMADKNLGATQVFNNSDTKSQSNCGKFFQRGNNYGFDWSGTLTTTSTRVNASSYGPGNYYSSSTFIKGSSSSSAYWDSSNNPNLWGGVTGALPSELGEAYLGKKPWEPNAHTVAYYKLATDAKDYSGNGYDLTANGTGITYTTLNGVSCAKSAGNPNYLESTTAVLPSGGASRTVLVWYAEVENTGIHYILNYGDTSTTGKFNFSTNTGKAEYRGAGSVVLNLNTRYLFTATYDSSITSMSGKFYLNASRKFTQSYTLTTPAVSSTYPFRLFANKSSNYMYYSSGYISEVIIEDRVWTADEITNYFNDTKGKYGLS